MLVLFSVCGAGSDVSFSPAVYVSEGPDADSHLLVFPTGRKYFSVPVPVLLRYYAFGASGQTIYGTTNERSDARTMRIGVGLVKIELNPVRVSKLAGFDAFSSIDRFAVSRREDLVLLIGRSKASAKTCGIYQATIPGGEVRTVLENPDCRGLLWRILDLSPDSKRALIASDRHLAILDLSDGRIEPVQGDLWGGAYSPDGKWIAALELAGPEIPSRTVLLDTDDLHRRRDLGGLNDDEVVWSPDSRFILHCVPRPACPSQNPIALETLDVQNGARTVIKDSICNSGSSRYIGWVRSDIGR